MSYGLLYISTFDPVTAPVPDPVYTIEILQKNYSGSNFNVLASGVPLVHSWQTDDPAAPIKGSSVSIGLINQGSLPLTSFYAQDDDTFKVRHLWKGQLLFEGFLVQDDCNEIMVDFDHEINLTATDNLGLLKKVALNESPAAYDLIFTSLETYEITMSGFDTIVLVSTAFGNTLSVGYKITLDGAGPYTIKNMIAGSGIWNLYLVENPATTVGSVTHDIGVYSNSLNDNISLLSVIKRCIKATGIDLITNIYCNIFETTQITTDSVFAQTFVNPQSFLKDEINYLDCYTILEQILTRFECTLFQSKGVWNIIKWSDLKYYSSHIPGFSYDTDFNLIGAVTFMEDFAVAPYNITAVPPTYPQTGLYRKILRPFNFDKEKFNYAQPKQLLRNYNLQQLGSLLRTTTTGSGINLQTTNEYSAPWWYDSTLNPVAADYFIRVVSDNLNNELERYMVVKQDGIKSYKIEVNAGDTFNYSFSYRTADSQPGVVGYTALVQLTDGTNTRFVRQPGRAPSDYIEPGWGGGPGWVDDILSGDNSNVWHTVTIQSQPIPFDGLLYVYLVKADLSGTDAGTFYKDIRFEYTPLINQSTKIIGHTHTDTQQATIKNNEETEIFIDSSPRNSIAGTLFINTMTGLLQTRTVKWKRRSVSESLNLGNITTFEKLFGRRIPRTIFEGTMIGLTQPMPNTYGVDYTIVDNGDGTQTVTWTFTSVPTGTNAVTVSYNDGTWHNNTGAFTSPRSYTMPVGTYTYRIQFHTLGGAVITYPSDNHVSLASVFKYSTYNDLNLICGKLDIDYRNNRFTATLWEQYNDTEVDADLTQIYNFDYLYAAK